jgi:metal-dependent amidase/aminoacylase/carboxypeptidase family protein
VVLRGGARKEDSTGVVPAVLLRGDMDGLPVTEATGFDFAATSGKMHACGHDLHTAGLVGALGLLHRVREHLPGDVVFMFQPGEEGYDGAGKMIDEGVLDAAGPRVKAAYGLHVSADAELGIASSRPDPIWLRSRR